MTKNIELPVVSKSVGGLSRESLETLAAVEASLTAQDTTEADRLNYKNAVEEYIYDIRDKVMLPELNIQIIFIFRGSGSTQRDWHENHHCQWEQEQDNETKFFPGP